MIFSGGITMETLAGMINNLAGRVVLDRTMLPGRYESMLRFAPPGTTANAANDPPSIFTALQEQLGLPSTRRARRSTRWSSITSSDRTAIDRTYPCVDRCGSPAGRRATTDNDVTGILTR